MNHDKVTNREIGEGKPCFIIAEGGVNHNGNIDIAKKLVNVAVDAKADAVKFQTFKSENIVTFKGEKAWHQKRAEEKTQFQMLRNLELSFDEFVELKNHCDSKKIEFMSTPYDPESVIFLNNLVYRFKISSADIINKSLLKSVAETKKQIILSDGMATMDEIKRSVEFIKSFGNNNIVLLHCTTSYPAPFDEINLNILKTLKNQFKSIIGYSDHSQGIEIPILSVGFGAKVIEKHFTLDRNMKGPDHFASIEPDEFKKMVSSIRNAEKAVGNDKKILSKNEKINLFHLRRSLHAISDIKMGNTLKTSDIGILRPNDGISPWEIDDIIGKKAKKNINKFEPITEDDI